MNSVYSIKRGNNKNGRDFFTQNPQILPWPKLLIQKGYGVTYKPREVKQKHFFDQIKFKKTDKVLDIGCGQGVILSRLQKQYNFNQGIGIDSSEAQINIAQNIKNKKLKFYRKNAENLPFGNNSFDVIICLDTLEHIRNQYKALEEMTRILKPGGRFLLYTISKKQKYTWNWWLEKIGIDIYNRVNHNPNLFLDIKKIKRYLETKKILILRTELFNSFFTLALDEIIMLEILIAHKFNLFKYQILGKIFLTIHTFFSKITMPLTDFFDYLWKKGGYSNSFFILGKKYEK